MCTIEWNAPHPWAEPVAPTKALCEARFKVGQQASKGKSQLGWNHLVSVRRYEYHTYLLDQGIGETISAEWEGVPGGWNTASLPNPNHSNYLHGNPRNFSLDPSLGPVATPCVRIWFHPLHRELRVSPRFRSIFLIFSSFPLDESRIKSEIGPIEESRKSRNRGCSNG